MLATHAFKKLTLASTLLLTTPLALASTNCVKPKVKGYDTSYMNCLGEGLVESSGDDESSIVFDANGKTIVPRGIYQDVFEFSEGLAGVLTTDYKAGYIDATGKIVIPAIYEPSQSGEGGGVIEVNPFKEGLASVSKNDSWGFINKNGKTIIPFKYVLAGNFVNGKAPVAVNKNDSYPYTWGYIDKSGKTVIPFAYEYAGSFSENVAVVVKNEKYGVIDTTGKMVVPAKYDHMNDFSDGLAVVFQRGTPIKNSDSVRGKYGFINKTGKVIIPIQYDLEYYGDLDLPDFKNGKAKIDILKNGKESSHCINKKGTKIKC